MIALIVGFVLLFLAFSLMLWLIRDTQRAEQEERLRLFPPDSRKRLP